MRNTSGQFVSGSNLERALPVGSVRIRTRHKRGGEQRAWIKVAEPNVWKLRAQYVWEAKNGPLPRGMVVHHKDDNKLNDAIENLEAMSKAQHLSEHMPNYREKTSKALADARRERRWSTKSETKRCGRHPKNCQCPLHIGKSA